MAKPPATIESGPPSRLAGSAGATRRFFIGLAVLTAAGAALRWAYIWFDRRHVEVFNDGFYYHHGANLLADGQGFVNPFAFLLQGRAVDTADHPPLYLLYLAVFSFLGLTSVTAHLFAGSLLGIGSIVVGGLAGRRIAGERVGLLGAALVAFGPNTWRYDGALLSEVGVIFLVLVVVALAYRAWDLHQPGLLVVIGAVIGAATLARPELLLLIPLLVVPLAWWSSELAVARRVGWIVASGAATLLVIAPWVAFNLARFDEPVLLSQNLGGTVAGSYCESTLEGPYIGYWDFNCAPRILDAAGITELGDERMDAVAREEGLRVARENLDRLPMVVAARLGRVAGVFRPLQQRDFDAETEGVSSWVATAGIVAVPITLVGAAAGAVVLRRRGRLVLPLLAPVAVVVVTVVVFYGATRFRSTAEGPLYLLAAVAVDAVWRRLGRDRGERTLT